MDGDTAFNEVAYGARFLVNLRAVREQFEKHQGIIRSPALDAIYNGWTQNYAPGKKPREKTYRASIDRYEELAQLEKYREQCTAQGHARLEDYYGPRRICLLSLDQLRQCAAALGLGSDAADLEAMTASELVSALATALGCDRNTSRRARQS